MSTESAKAPTIPHRPTAGNGLSAGWVQAIVIAGLLVFVFWDIINSRLISRWINDGNWSHCWLVPAFSAYYLASRREELQAVQPRTNWLGAMILLGSLAIFFFSGWQLRAAYPQAIALVGAIFGATLLLGGMPLMRVAWFPIGFLVMAVPLPSSMYVQLTLPLRQLATRIVAAVLPLLKPGLYAEAQSVVIDYRLPDAAVDTLNVEEACSGMRSLMGLLTLGVAIAFVKDRPAWQRLVLIIAGVPIAVFCNAIRVTITGLLHVNGMRDWAQGSPHLLLGMLTFALGLGLFALLGYMLENLFIESADET